MCLKCLKKVQKRMIVDFCWRLRLFFFFEVDFYIDTIMKRPSLSNILSDEYSNKNLKKNVSLYSVFLPSFYAFSLPIHTFICLGSFKNWCSAVGHFGNERPTLRPGGQPAAKPVECHSSRSRCPEDCGQIRLRTHH